MVKKYFNSKDIKLVKAIKEKVKNLKPLELPLEGNYFIIETNASKVGWGAILKQKPNKYSPKADEKNMQICFRKLQIKDGKQY